MYIRGLYEAWSRSDINSDIAKLIGSFITVQVRSSPSWSRSIMANPLLQLNALLDLAEISGTNQFSPGCVGPAYNGLLPWTQLVAMDVFNAAIGMAPRNAKYV